MKNILFILSGPSGVGKGTLANLLRERNKNVALSISCTTRQPREHETDGKEYFFISKDEFIKEIESDGFLEYSSHFGNYYGTPRKFVENKLKTHDVMLEIDVNGGLSVKKNYKDAILIFIAPPSFNELKNRLINRHTETEDKIEERLQRIDYEFEKEKQYDYTVINDDLNRAVSELEKIINEEKNK
ncbi:MAG: guanylate kinase [Clostridia bacterium]|nr:guanylate kinase [Clostridia bacterium]